MLNSEQKIIKTRVAHVIGQSSHNC